ncbi:MAG: PmoA family protein [candidate division KSB1 bacterium]|nr:PmoA family protein [candidate division KSB1 bacterium]
MQIVWTTRGKDLISVLTAKVHMGQNVGWLVAFGILLGTGSIPARSDESRRPVRFLEKEGAVEVYIGQQLFTVFRPGGVLNRVRLTRPTLWPVLSPRGAPVTRCWPLGDCGREEPTDHAHHQGIWLAYGRIVVGERDTLDTWAVYRPLPDGPPSSTRYRPGERGIVTCDRVSVDKAGAEIFASCTWLSETSGKPFLVEERTMHFSGGQGWRAVDFLFRLRTLDLPVEFLDSKEGFFGLRVGPDLAESEAEETASSSSRPRSSGFFAPGGAAGEAQVWGKRFPWVALKGTLSSGEPMTLALMDHPDNVNHPAPWMARGYGLFAVDPFGTGEFTEGRDRLHFRLPAGGSVTFQYRLQLWSRHLSPEKVEEAYRHYVRDTRPW